MSDIRIEVFNGEYSNEDAYEGVLDYIKNKAYVGGYGFTLNCPYSIIEQFRMSELSSNYSNPQKMWHFIITFENRWKHLELLQLANQIAFAFAPDYQILYGLDIKDHAPHLHFGINAFSYHPDTPILTTDKMQNYMKQLRQALSKLYPMRTVTLQFQGKRCA